MIIIEGPKQAAKRTQAKYEISIENRKECKLNLVKRKQKLRELFMDE